MCIYIKSFNSCLQPFLAYASNYYVLSTQCIGINYCQKIFYWFTSLAVLWCMFALEKYTHKRINKRKKNILFEIFSNIWINENRMATVSMFIIGWYVCMTSFFVLVASQKMTFNYNLFKNAFIKWSRLQRGLSNMRSQAVKMFDLYAQWMKNTAN